jgi:predicted Fe-S protein YdhL (DUF1289 family)
MTRSLQSSTLTDLAPQGCAARETMAGIHITDIETAINWWRERHPSPDGIAACAEVRALAEVYALMVYFREPYCDEVTMPSRARDAWLQWYATTPDSPCIAICSTSQGDPVCKGCGRLFDEVQNWTAMTPAEKRATWHRITQEHSAWRFNRYAERARLCGTASTPTHEPVPLARPGSEPATAQNPTPAPESRASTSPEVAP